jgi:hypothetical protein
VTALLEKRMTESPDGNVVDDNDDLNRKLAQYTQTTAIEPELPNYTEFFTHVKEAGRITETKTKQTPSDWFELSKEKIQPIINTMTALLKQIRECNNEQLQTNLSRQLKLANKIRNITVAEAKSKYLSKLAEEIGELSGTNCKNSWKAVRQCKLGNKTNYKKQKIMSLRLPNGQRAKTDKENMSVFHPNCIRVFNNHRIVSSEALNFITQCETFAQLDNPIPGRNS